MLARTAFPKLRAAPRPKLVKRPGLAPRGRGGRFAVFVHGLFLALAWLSSTRSASAESQPERPLPDYDGRGGRGQPTTPGQVALWVPRVVLSPLYLVSEYVVRRPLGYLITAAEKAEVPAALYDFFAFGPDHKAGFVPIAFVDFGFYPSVGVYAFWDDAGFKGHNLRLRATTGGSRWLSGAVSERFEIARGSTVSLNASASRRPDYAYYGERSGYSRSRSQPLRRGHGGPARNLARRILAFELDRRPPSVIAARASTRVTSVAIHRSTNRSQRASSLSPTATRTATAPGFIALSSRSTRAARKTVETAAVDSCFAVSKASTPRNLALRAGCATARV